MRADVPGFEASAISAREWERAILDGYRVWRQVRANDGGKVIGDMLAGTLEYRLD